MKCLFTTFLSVVSAVAAFADHTASQVAAKAALEESVRREEDRGSIYAQARIDGIDYRTILRKAIDLDEDAIKTLFSMRFMGEGGESHCANLLLLMKLWGDDHFAKTLAGRSERIRDLVVGSIDYAWANPEWNKYPRTLETSPNSITKRTKAEQ